MHSDTINYDEIIDRCKKKGVSLTWRKLNYYKTLGLLPKAERREKDKRGYYPEYIIFVLQIYHFLQNHVGMTLDEIGENLAKFKGKSSDVRVFYLFADWVNLTYGEYLAKALRHMQDRGVALGAALMGPINWIYRTEFEKSGASFHWKKLDMTKGAKCFKDGAERWSERAITLLREALDNAQPKLKADGRV